LELLVRFFEFVFFEVRRAMVTPEGWEEKPSELDYSIAAFPNRPKHPPKRLVKGCVLS
jgi:hypothetical protein